MAAEYDEGWNEFLDSYQKLKEERDVLKYALEVFINKYVQNDSELGKAMRAELEELVDIKEVTNGSS